MPIPNWIPTWAKEMMVSFRPATDKDDIDDLFLLRDFQKEAMLQKEFEGDKGRAVKNNANQIEKVKGYLKIAKQAKKGSKAHERLEKWLEQLEQERFQLFRNEILNACKSSGTLDTVRLARFPGFKGDKLYREQQKKEKEKQKQKAREIKINRNNNTNQLFYKKDKK